MTRTQGVIMTKAALRLLGLPGGVTRLAAGRRDRAQIEQLRTDLVAGGVKLPGARHEHLRRAGSGAAGEPSAPRPQPAAAAAP